MPSTSVVELDRVTKTYPVLRTPFDVVRWAAGGHAPAHVTAIDGLSLRVEPGEVLGVVGNNGAGKSTLLRLVAGVTRPSTGEVRVRARPYPVLDLSVGLTPSASGRRNVLHRLGLTGLSRREAAALVDEVAAFAELEAVIDEPLFTYSSGMRVRLAFAAAMATRPELLVLDEVLAVGDGFFVAKSLRRVQEVARAGRAALVSSHDWASLFRTCTRVVWLDRGRVVADGPPGTVLYDYLAAAHPYRLTGEARVVRVEVLDGAGVATRAIEAGAPVRVRVELEVATDRPLALFVQWKDRFAAAVLSAWSPDEGFTVRGPGRWVVETRYAGLPLAPGEHEVFVLVADEALGPAPPTFCDMYCPMAGRRCTVQVGGPATGEGAVLRLPTRWSQEPAA